MLKMKEWSFPARITNVVDGDTVDMVIDLGFEVCINTRIRLVDIDTPERGQEGFHEAKEYLETYLGKDIKLVTAKKGKYGRWLGALYDTINPESINIQMIRKGLGVPYGRNLPIPRKGKL
jgi:micrococcal nuclease